MNAAPHAGHGETEAPDRRVEDDLRAIERDEERLRQADADLARDERKLEHDLHHPEPPVKQEHRVEMNYQPLTLHGDKLNGLQIKEQAIAAPIPNIKVNFHLTVERVGDAVEHTIDDNEEWTVQDGDCFTAVDPDDNS